MALQAGRVGVSPQDVDNRGHITAGGLTPEEKSKLNRSLVSPITAPTEKEFVGVGTGNEQIMIKAGKGVAFSGSISPFTITIDPAPTAADAGKVLTVTAEGDLEWHEAGGGGVSKIAKADMLNVPNAYISTTGNISSGGSTPVYGINLSDLSLTGTLYFILDSDVGTNLRVGLFDAVSINKVSGVDVWTIQSNGASKVTYNPDYPYLVIGLVSNSAASGGLDGVNNIRIFEW